MELGDIAGNLPAVKSGIDSLRNLLGLVRDVQGILPAGEKKDAVAAALATAETQAKVAEAQIAQALGYELCRCTFPPTTMLTVGWRPILGADRAMLQTRGTAPGAIVVHECPRCGQHDAGGFQWTRTAPARKAAEGAAE